MTVGDQTVELIVEVEELLDQRVGRHAAGGAGGLLVEAGRVAGADDLHRGVRSVCRAVADGVDPSIELGAAGLVLDVVAKETQQRNHPEVAGLGGGVAAFLHRLQLALEDAPVVLGVGPGAGDLVLDLDAGVEGEVGRPLTGKLLDLPEDIRREDGAFDADARVVHAEPSGRRMYIPIRSMGRTG